MSRPPSITLEEESRRAFINLLPLSWVHRDMVPDYHIDMEVVIAEDRKVTNEVLWVQIKATENIAHPHGVIPFPIETRHLKYYENSRLPVIILLWVKPENTFYYLFAQQYIRERLSKEDPAWRTQETKTIKFLADSKLMNADTLKSIGTDGYLYIIQHETSIRSEAGLAGAWLDGIPQSNDQVLKEHTLKALLCMRNEDYKGAIAEYKHILRVVCKTSSTERMSILLNLGNAHYWLGQSDEALDDYDAVLKLAKEITKKDALEGKASALGNIGMVYYAKSDLDKALKYLEAALKVDQEIGYRKGQVGQLSNIGLVYRAKGDLDKALKYFQDALKADQADQEIGYRGTEVPGLGTITLVSEEDLSTMQRYRLGEASDLSNIGLVYLDKDDLDKALKFLQDALKIHREVGYRLGEAIDLSNIGLVYRHKGDLDNALKYLEAALKIYQEIGYRLGEASDLSNIGLVYLDKGDLDNALKYHQDALKIHREIGYKQGEANALGNIGLVYRHKGDLDNALKYLEAALKVLDMAGLTYGRDTILRAINSIKNA
jgi:tetratricopeptide (TPR) repeat protein